MNTFLDYEISTENPDYSPTLNRNVTASTYSFCYYIRVNRYYVVLRHGSNECDNYSSDELIVRWPLARLEAFFSRSLNRSIVTLCYA
jgi:hypothetical protein